MKTRKPSSDRIAEIISATLDLAFAVGPDHVKTGMIASQLGITQPAIYKHFPGKKEIWLGVAKMLCARINENIQAGEIAGQPAAARLRGLVLSHLHLISEYPALPEIMVSRDPTGTLTEARHRIQSAMSDYRVALARHFKNVQAQEGVREIVRSEDGVALIFGVIQSLVLRLIVTRDPNMLLTEGTHLLDLQLMLFNPEGTMP